MAKLLFAITLLFSLLMTAETITVKTKAPQNRNAMFHLEFIGYHAN